KQKARLYLRDLRYTHNRHGNRLRPQRISLSKIEGALTEEHDPDDKVQAKKDWALAVDAGKLTFQEQCVLWAVHVHGLTWQEVARELGERTETVKSRFGKRLAQAVRDGVREVISEWEA